MAVLAVLVLAVVPSTAGPGGEPWWLVPAMTVAAGVLLSALVRISIALMTDGPPSSLRR